MESDDDYVLFESIQNKQKEITQCLIEHGAYLNISDETNNNCILIPAIENDDIEMMKYLLSLEDIYSFNLLNEINQNGHTPLTYSIYKNRTSLSKLLIESGSNIEYANQQYQNYNSLHYATLNNNLEIIELLISKGININSLTTNKETALHIASKNNFVSIAKYLCNNGIDVYKSTRDEGYTAFHYASEYGCKEILSLLYYQYSYDPRIRTKDGSTALHLATKYDQYSTVKFLIEKCKLSINDLDMDGNTPLHIAASNDFYIISQYLIHLGANKHIKNHHNKTPQDVAQGTTIELFHITYLKLLIGLIPVIIIIIIISIKSYKYWRDHYYYDYYYQCYKRYY